MDYLEWSHCLLPELIQTRCWQDAWRPYVFNISNEMPVPNVFFLYSKLLGKFFLNSRIIESASLEKIEVKKFEMLNTN